MMGSMIRSHAARWADEARMLPILALHKQSIQQTVAEYHGTVAVIL
ncbi:MAG: hypothetical protein HY268_20930 [Deltaproteobacteria bacterium]|nr:hypothetical protein [Deltaproteobacteria bacterium]